MKKAMVSVIVPNYNGAEYLRDCLGSLAEQTLSDVEVVVVDNASSDGSPEKVERDYPWVNLVRLALNRGFAAAVNAGVSASAGEFVILLNNDTRAEPDFVEELHASIVKSGAAMAAPKMLFARDPRIINSMGLGYCVTGTNHDIGFGREDGENFAESREIFGPCGGAGMYRRSMLEDVGSLDESFFMYYEDVDLAFRAQLAGHKCISVPSARVYHIEGAGGASLPRSRNYYFTRNAVAVIAHNFPRRLLIRHFHTLIWEMVKRAGSPALSGDISAILGYLAGLARLGDSLGKRRVIQRRRRASDEYIEEMLVKNLSVLGGVDLRGRPAPVAKEGGP